MSREQTSREHMIREQMIREQMIREQMSWEQKSRERAYTVKKVILLVPLPAAAEQKGGGNRGAGNR